MKLFRTAALAALLLVNSLASTTPKANDLRIVDLTIENTIIFQDRIEPISVFNLASDLEAKRAILPIYLPIFLVINSGGGKVQGAYAIQAILKKTPNIQVICLYCASGAGLVFATAQKRLALMNSEMIMHEIYVNHITAAAILNPEFIISLFKESEAFNRQIYSIIGISREKYTLKIVNTEWSVKGANLVKLHLADELVKLKCDDWIATLLSESCS